MAVNVMLWEVISYVLYQLNIYTHYNGERWITIFKPTGTILAEGTLRGAGAYGADAPPALRY